MQATRGEKAYRGMPMEGLIARWYSGLRSTESQIAQYREEAARLTTGLPDGAAVLEVAPGPGYFAIEVARLGRLRVTGLDVSRSFVQIAGENARKTGVEIDFRRGDASSMPFPEGSFHLVVCQAAFKNFSRPEGALNEMHRVLREGGTAVIQDMSHEATNADIREEVKGMHLGWASSLMTRTTLGSLRRRAYTREAMRELAESSRFGGCEITTAGIGMNVRLTKRHAVH
jgi:ubiquinone/menaquinone biosynthesis C-methylase UbiE